MTAQFKTSDQLFWAELRHDRATKRSLQVCYALLIAEHHRDGPVFWEVINRAVIRRFKMKRNKELVHFQECAREIYSNAAFAAAPSPEGRTNEQARRDDQEASSASA